jgi:threonine/homoserine/homoserine lactone efflux protein
MVIDPANFALFLAASLLLILAPGPDILFLISQGATKGSRAGFMTALGLASGNLVHTLGAALGVSVIFRASPLAFQGLKLAGVGYLLFLAWKTVRARDRSAGEPTGGVKPSRAHNLFWRGFLMNVLNPKVALFFLAFLPQFASPAAGPVWAQMLVYGLIFALLVVVIFGAIGIFSGQVSRWLARRGGSDRGAKRGRWVVAGVYAALAARLAFVHR